MRLRRRRVEREPLALHDERVPLPPGAAQELRPDHPRLLELRAAYDALDLPVRATSRWSPERVGAFLDLQRFRGETLITWHYREDPQATERRYDAMRRHAAAHDPGGILGRLEEDGAFGCWTFDPAGTGPVSRDLLDSARELAFLERELGIGARPGLRVLDVGAGYGRLAHRMTTAFPDVGDYCCVDAIAESTFVSEYYLRFRGACPPARVVALHELEAALEPGAFDLAVNVHSFSECTLEAVTWWLGLLARLRVPSLLVVPNEPAELLSLEADGSRRDFAPALERAGYELVRREPVYDDPAVGIGDHFHLYALRG